MELADQVFVITLIVGLILFGAEIFVPGGILGTLGAIALVAAIIAGFFAFPGYGGYVALGIIFLLGIAIVLWIKLFPKSRIGKQMTVTKDLGSASAAEDGLNDLLGKSGTTSSDLRPSGFAMFDGRRVDVVTEGEMIDKGVSIKVVEVEGNRVVVAEQREQPPSEAVS